MNAVENVLNSNMRLVDNLADPKVRSLTLRSTSCDYQTCDAQNSQVWRLCAQSVVRTPIGMTRVRTPIGETGAVERIH